jgi:serine protease Do
MDAVEREPCTNCAEPVATEARQCPHCRVSVLVDVHLDRPATDGKVRYQAARALAALDGSWPPVGTLQGILATTQPLARGLTRAQGRRIQQTLAAQGLSGSLAGALPPSARTASRAWLPLAVVGVVAAVTAGAWFALRRSPAPPGAPAPAAVTAAAAAPGAAPLTTAEIARRALPSTALLRCEDGLGSGFFVSPDMLVTNAHVLCPAGETIRVTFADGRGTTAEVLKSDPEIDLALLRVTGDGAPPLPLGDAGQLTVGDRVVFVGNPMGMEFTVHEGIVSSLSRSILGTAYVQLDAKINPGNSGGPVLDTQGRVVAVVSMKHPQAEGLGLALPINYAYPAHRSLLPDGPTADSPIFQAMLDRVAEEERRQAGEVSDALAGHQQLFLDGGRIDQYGRLVARILQPASAPLGPQTVAFKFWNGTVEVCSAKAEVPTWDVVATQEPDERIKAWLDKHGLALKVYKGEALIAVEQHCGRTAVTRGTVMELVGAHPEASRAALY